MIARDNTNGSLSAVFSSHRWFSQSIALCFAYLVWIASFRLVFLTVVTYFVASPGSRFQDISDIFSSNEVSLMGLAAAIFVGLSFALFPLSRNRVGHHLNAKHIEEGFIPGFWRGSLVAFAVVIALILFGAYQYLGYLIPFEETPLSLVNIFLRMMALAVLVYCEEYLFRYRIANYLVGLPLLWSAFWTSLLFCLVKLVQFDLSIMHLITLFLISFVLTYRAEGHGAFARSAGYWAAILIIFHPLLSLPIFGNDFSGVLLVRYQNTSSGTNASVPPPVTPGGSMQQPPPTSGLSSPSALNPIASQNQFARILSGGAGGPLSSFIFQLILILDIGRNIFLRKKRKAI